MMLALPRIPLTLPVFDASCRARSLAWQLQRATDLLLPPMTTQEGSGEHTAGGSADPHSAVPATAPGRSRQSQACPAGS
jgi:hypothetical protein